MPGRELTDPGSALPAPTTAEVRLAFAEVERSHPEAAEVLRRAIEALEARAFTPDLLREVVTQLERSNAMQTRIEPILERGVEALEAEAEARRRAVALKERAETAKREEAEAGRTTALEHIRGAWATVKAAFENKAVVAMVGGGIAWLATRLYEGLSAWWLQP